ncbi:hypothetical protein PR048_015332 [Dryococelus australis]|uniref:Uncharacterized protein n=1 Tax=Dryococelus australis TaxID=614101 RepID=A0ABQ9HGN1_9NEOP|nr:hypothetical protein PR048_015332 [Dryococelus australis]
MMKRLNEQKNAIIMTSSREDATISAELTHHLEIPIPKGTALQSLNDLLARLKQEFSFIHTNELIPKATVLDPRFKLNPFQQEKHSVFLIPLNTQ